MGIGQSISLLKAVQTRTLTLKDLQQYHNEIFEWEKALNEKDERGRNCIWWCAQTGQANCLQMLLDRGARTDTLDNNGNSPLYVAVTYGHKKCIQLLLKERKIRTKWYDTTFLKDDYNKAKLVCLPSLLPLFDVVVELFQEAICNPVHPDDFLKLWHSTDNITKETLRFDELHRHLLSFLVAHGKEEHIRLVLSDPTFTPQLERKDESHLTCLGIAVSKKKIKIVKLLLEHGASPTYLLLDVQQQQSKYQHKCTPLELIEYQEMLQLLSSFSFLGTSFHFPPPVTTTPTTLPWSEDKTKLDNYFACPDVDDDIVSEKRSHADQEALEKIKHNMLTLLFQPTPSNSSSPRIPSTSSTSCSSCGFCSLFSFGFSSSATTNTKNKNVIPTLPKIQKIQKLSCGHCICTYCLRSFLLSDIQYCLHCRWTITSFTTLE
jgi:ankyrin repeat protein